MRSTHRIYLFSDVRRWMVDSLRVIGTKGSFFWNGFWSRRRMGVGPTDTDHNLCGSSMRMSLLSEQDCRDTSRSWFVVRRRRDSGRKGRHYKRFGRTKREITLLVRQVKAADVRSGAPLRRTNGSGAAWPGVDTSDAPRLHWESPRTSSMTSVERESRPCHAVRGMHTGRQYTDAIRKCPGAGVQ